MTTIAIIQARTGSQRFPNKVLQRIGEWFVIEHVIARAQLAVPHVVVAMPAAEACTQLPRAVENMGAIAFVDRENAESDVLARFAFCADWYDADVIVRITADCPFVQPDHITKVVDALVNPKPLCSTGALLSATWLEAAQHPAYASNVHPVRTFPDGLDVEAFTMDALEEWDRTISDPQHREHVTSYVRAFTSWSPGLMLHPSLGNHRWTLDTREDLAWFRRIAAEIDVTPPHPAMDELLALIERKPELARYNEDA